LPLSFHLEWPFHLSTSGSDFWVLHGDIVLENSAGLHSPVAVTLSATVREVTPSLAPEHAQAPVINALRKEVDRKQLEFLKSGKLVPVHFSSRHYDFKRNKWVFGRATDEQMATLVMRKVYWQTRLVGGEVWLGDGAEAQYVETTTEHLVGIANGLAKQGLSGWNGVTPPRSRRSWRKPSSSSRTCARPWSSWRKSMSLREGKARLTIFDCQLPIGIADFRLRIVDLSLGR
jgi:hypothetical protein